MDLFGRIINFKHKERYGFYDKNKKCIRHQNLKYSRTSLCRSRREQWFYFLIAEYLSCRVSKKNSYEIYYKLIRFFTSRKLWAKFELTTFVVKGTDCTVSCKSNYHMIMTMTAHYLQDKYNNISLLYKMSNIRIFPCHE